MAKILPKKLSKRLGHRYKMVVMNNDTYEEVAAFKLTRMTVYIGLSTIFVFLVGITVAILVLTPLKYYIPGYGAREGVVELRNLKVRTDSLQRAMDEKDKYMDNLKQVLSGGVAINKRDTSVLNIPKPDISND